jgi:phosphoribosylformylglycinamidine (FGAM) synthase-like amidotransferase family enzyme
MVWVEPVATSKLIDFPYSHIKGNSVRKNASKSIRERESILLQYSSNYNHIHICGGKPCTAPGPVHAWL